MKNTPNRAINTPKSKLIFALDVGGSLAENLAWVDQLKGHVGLFKVGKEAFTRFGPELIHEIRARDAEVFLDLKFHDIPSTVARAAEAAFSLGVSMFNVHALGGKAMMSAAVRALAQAAAGRVDSAPALLAVTVLTSMNGDDLCDMGISQSIAEMVVRLASLAQEAGISGVVASAGDIAAIRQSCGRSFLIVTPGIRGTLAIARDDQKRIWTAYEAIRSGADYIVVGRPIRTAKDPVAEAEKFVKEIAEGIAAGSEQRVTAGSM
jgi:orotidine-5'-phosphate decarboxylase